VRGCVVAGGVDAHVVDIGLVHVLPGEGGREGGKVSDWTLTTRKEGREGGRARGEGKPLVRR